MTEDVGGIWTRTTSDGLGRVVKTETGDINGLKLTVDTEYAACGCTPLAR